MTRQTLAAVAAAVVLGCGVPAAAAREARRVLEEGLSHLAAQRYDEAAARFAEAATMAGAEDLDPAVAAVDRGIALLRAGKGAEAAAVLAEALHSPDPRLRESAQYHRGIALTAAGEAAERAGDPGTALALLEEALTAYEGAMRIDPRDEDPKVNHELVARKKARLEEQRRERERNGGAGRGQTAGDRPPETERPQGGEPAQPEQGARTSREGRSPQEMRPDEARVLLDALRQQEQSQRGRARSARGETVFVGKDW